MPYTKGFVGGLILLMFLGIWSCDTKDLLEAPSIDYEALPYSYLSQYSFFDDNNIHKPLGGVVEYEPSAALFSDYAFKKRYVYLPENAKVSLDKEEVEFPEGSILIKHFYYPKDFRNPDEEQDWIETRLLIKRKGIWESYSYIWDELQQEAELSLVGDIVDVEWIDEQGASQSLEYTIPNKNQCKSCHHANGVLKPIGPRLETLMQPLEGQSEKYASQWAYWSDLGMLDSLFSWDGVEAMPDWSNAQVDLHKRALSYLDMNCGHCHNLEGSAHTSGLFLKYTEKSPSRWGVKKSPVAAGKGSGGRSYDIVPQYPDSSILVFRMESEDPGIMMPELGRSIRHEEGIALIREWIKNM